jgi:hypothetical protein
MSQLFVLICWVDDDENDGPITELACVDLSVSTPDVPRRQLDCLEASALQSG